MTAAGSIRIESFSSRVRDFIAGLECRPARTLDEREAIFRLRYEAYAREGAIAPNASKLFKDRYDDLPNVHNFACYHDGRLVSSLRLHVGSPRHPVTPSISVFGDILGPEIDTGKIIIDPTRFVADPLLARDFPYLPQATVRLPFLACEHFGADVGLAACREEHRAFYRRMFFLDQAGEPRPYPPLTKPIALLRFDYRATKDRVVARHPFMASTLAERERLFGVAPQRITPRLIRSGRPTPVAPPRASARPFSIHAA